jgi:hypothetical protein
VFCITPTADWKLLLLLLLRHQVHIGDTVRLGVEVSEGKGKTRTQVGYISPLHNPSA